MATEITLLAMSGWGVSHTIWEPLKKALPSWITLRTCPLPGYGDTSSPDLLYAGQAIERLYDQPYELATYIMRHAEGNVWLLGWSLGGQVASWVAHYYPERTLGLITVASNPCFVSTQYKSGADSFALWPGMSAPTFRRFKTSFLKNSEPTLERFYGLVASLSPTMKSHDRDLYRWLKSAHKKHCIPSNFLGKSLSCLESWDTRPCLLDLRVPQHHCFAELDQLVPSSLYEALGRSRFSYNCETYTYAGKGVPPEYEASSIIPQQSHGLPWSGAQVLSQKVVDVISFYTNH